MISLEVVEGGEISLEGEGGQISLEVEGREIYLEGSIQVK